MKRFVLFFVKGPGIALVILGVIVGVGLVIKQGQDKRAQEADKRQKTRELGQVAPKVTVDQSAAAPETLLSSRHLNPGFTTAPEATPIPNAVSTGTGRQQGALPTLVSFYAQVQATPTATPVPEPTPARPEYWLPPSSFIPCTLVNTVESSHINTPVVGEVTRDCYQNGKLIIPAGTIVSSFAESGAVRDRIEVAGMWLFVFSDGRQLKVPGIACDREADPSNQQFGIEDGSAGLQGELQDSDHWANAKAFLALLMTTANQAITAGASSAIPNRFGGGVALPDTSAIQAKYLDQLFNGQTGDGRFVRVRASTEFYIFPTETVLPAKRSIVNSAAIKTGDEQPPLSTDPGQQAMELQRELLKTQQQPTQNDSPKFHY